MCAAGLLLPLRPSMFCRFKPPPAQQPCVQLVRTAPLLALSDFVLHERCRKLWHSGLQAAHIPAACCPPNIAGG